MLNPGVSVLKLDVQVERRVAIVGHLNRVGSSSELDKLAIGAQVRKGVGTVQRDRSVFAVDDEFVTFDERGVYGDALVCRHVEDGRILSS